MENNLPFKSYFSFKLMLPLLHEFATGTSECDRNYWHLMLTLVWWLLENQPCQIKGTDRHG